MNNCVYESVCVVSLRKVILVTVYYVCNADVSQIQKAAATMILKTRENHRIPLSVVDSIIYDVQSLFDIVISNLSSQVQACLQSSGVSQRVAEGVDSIFSNCPRLFAGLQTQQQQLCFFRRNYNFVVSMATKF